MSERAEQRVVLLALGSTATRDWREPYKIAALTPHHLPPAASGRAQPYGERRVRKLLNELVEQGYAQRRRSFYIGMTYKATRKGREVR